jgi:hypothetical protein
LLTITLTPSDALTPTQIDDLYALAERAGFRHGRGTFEKTHFVHRPTLVMAYANGQLLGVQSYNTYLLQTPFFRGKVPFIYGGLAFQDNTLAGRGLSYRLSRYYMQQTLGQFFFLKKYAFAIRTPTPRLMQILSVQHQLVHFKNNLLTPDVARFAQDFLTNVRRVSDRLDARLVVRGEPTPTNITAQWPTLFRATNNYYNQLAEEADLIQLEAERQVLTGNYLLLFGYSSLRQLLRSILTLG